MPQGPSGKCPGHHLPGRDVRPHVGVSLVLEKLRALPGGGCSPALRPASPSHELPLDQPQPQASQRRLQPTPFPSGQSPWHALQQARSFSQWSPGAALVHLPGEELAAPGTPPALARGKGRWVGTASCETGQGSQRPKAAPVHVPLAPTAPCELGGSEVRDLQRGPGLAQGSMGCEGGEHAVQGPRVITRWRLLGLRCSFNRAMWQLPSHNLRSTDRHPGSGGSSRTSAEPDVSVSLVKRQSRPKFK